MPTSTVTSKGQVTIPKAIRERLGLSEGDTLEFAIDDAGRIVARPAERRRGVCGVLRDFAPQRPVTVEAMKEAVRRRTRCPLEDDDRIRHQCCRPSHGGGR
ncbi:MAG TPA: AbrB/MazE/SpoVT family DNA-binding domain-containing protein [Vicinamibacteria bacterium]|jgi:AbrB family looped-hinge helix DNA binding protein